MTACPRSSAAPTTFSTTHFQRQEIMFSGSMVLDRRRCYGIACSLRQNIVNSPLRQAMDVLSLLKEEDDNPRGRGGATEASGRVHQGATLDEAAAVEAARQEAKERRIPLREQEAGILHLLQAKSLFARLRLPEPHYDADGKLLWTPPGDLVLRRVYDDLSRCCAPDVSQHPKREEGFVKLMSEAYDTISNKNGRRDCFRCPALIAIAY